MIQNLKSIKFDNLSNNAYSRQGWEVGYLATVNTLAGNDIIDGRDNLGNGDYIGIYNLGTITTGLGDDKVIGQAMLWGGAVLSWHRYY